MTDHWEALNTWHADLGILADAIGHVLTEIEDPVGLSATAYVLRTKLYELVESCPFPDRPLGRIAPVADFDPEDFDYALPVDTAGVPSELLEGAAHD